MQPITSFRTCRSWEINNIKKRSKEGDRAFSFLVRTLDKRPAGGPASLLGSSSVQKKKSLGRAKISSDSHLVSTLVEKNLIWKLWKRENIQIAQNYWSLLDYPPRKRPCLTVGGRLKEIVFSLHTIDYAVMALWKKCWSSPGDIEEGAPDYNLSRHMNFSIQETSYPLQMAIRSRKDVSSFE